MICLPIDGEKCDEIRIGFVQAEGLTMESANLCSSKVVVSTYSGSNVVSPKSNIRLI